jgi:arsenate reductase
MAEGLLRALGGPDVAAFSAGTVATSVRPEAVTVMRELGIDISNHESKTLDRFLDEPFDEVITVCDDANDACPVFSRARHRRHWTIADPSHVTGSETERLAAFRQARDKLRARIDGELLPTLRRPS